LRGHFRIEARASIFVVVMPDDHHPVVMMPAVIAMFAILGACVAIAMPDDDGFGTGDRRGRYSNGNNRRNDISKLLHDVLLLRVRGSNIGRSGTFPIKPERILNGCSA
jgi:hypothetical protein